MSKSYYFFLRPFLLYSQLKLNKIFFPFDSNNYYLYENQT